ncbi:hypothetical protein OUZ56_003401 [Daphnia magna]|uniref:Uncharacterized protein n=1 Tax=Daphnia magna TaxID=35525 RepID=A0ABR0A8P0_9CRUS|nr:hypothetical protein OUZ56_003401 [Daphnia magna]
MVSKGQNLHRFIIVGLSRASDIQLDIDHRDGSQRRFVAYKSTYWSTKLIHHLSGRSVQFGGSRHLPALNERYPFLLSRCGLLGLSAGPVIEPACARFYN